MAAAPNIVPYTPEFIASLSLGRGSLGGVRTLSPQESMNLKIILHRRLPERVNLDGLASLAGERAKAEFYKAVLASGGLRSAQGWRHRKRRDWQVK